MNSADTSRVLVTGAAGVLGGAVVDELRRLATPLRGAGRRSRPPGFVGDWISVDLVSGRGVRAAVQDVGAVIHCASDPSKPASDLIALDTLIQALAGRDAHLVYVGIAGIDAAAEVFDYYRIKRACEARLTESGLRHTIVRATQFHPFVRFILQRLSLGPLLLLPAMTLQPVDLAFVAQRLIAHALGPDLGRAPDVCGPQALKARALASEWMSARGRRKLIAPAPSLGPLAGLSGITLVSGDTGGATWSQWLAGPDGGAAAYRR